MAAREPFHGSMIVTTSALGIPPIYHHLYNFGNLPVFLAFGETAGRGAGQAPTAPPSSTSMWTTRCLRRIVDGAYYAAAFKHMVEVFKTLRLG